MNRSITKLALTATAAVAASGLAATGAEAAPTCTFFASGVLEFRFTKDEDVATIRVDAGAIRISSANGAVFCAGGTPTTATIDAVLVVDDSDDLGTPVGRDGDTRVEIRDPTDFAPGATPEADGASEIEFFADPNSGRDKVAVVTENVRPSAQSMVAGNGGVSWTTDADADLRGMPFDSVILVGGSGADLLSAQGSRGTGAPLSVVGEFTAVGGDGPDRLLGSDIAGGDLLHGGAGDDVLEGAGGDDQLFPNGDGGPGA